MAWKKKHRARRGKMKKTKQNMKRANVYYIYSIECYWGCIVPNSLAWNKWNNYELVVTVFDFQQIFKYFRWIDLCIGIDFSDVGLQKEWNGLE